MIDGFKQWMAMEEKQPMFYHGSQCLASFTPPRFIIEMCLITLPSSDSIAPMYICPSKSSSFTVYLGIIMALL